MKLPIPFPNPRTYIGHSGVDYGQPRGTVFRASGPGKVLTLGKNTRGGYYIWVEYDDGTIVGYHHMDSHKGCPASGSRVSEGTQLGYVGSKGLFSTGPHLHSEVRGHATTKGYWKFFDADRVVGAKPAGGDAVPIIPTRRRKMYILYETRGYTPGQCWIMGASGMIANVPTMSLYKLLKRFQNDEGPFNIKEIEQCQYYIYQVAPPGSIAAGGGNSDATDLKSVLDAIGKLPTDDSIASRLRAYFSSGK